MSVENIIAAGQIFFIGKVVQDLSSDWPAKMMLTASFNNLRPEQGGFTQ